MRIKFQKNIKKTQVTGLFIVLYVGLYIASASANISGFVVDQASNPIPNASVQIQNDVNSPIVLTAADGSFNLPVNPVGTVMITATLTYDPNIPLNYPIEQNSANNGDTGVILVFQVLTPNDNPNYIPPPPEFVCEVCHIDQVEQWQQSNHSESATNVWVLDLFSGTGTPDGDQGFVFTETHDPDETGFCATCHAP